MNEKKKTYMFAGAGILLALLALVTTPRQATPDAFLDQGEEFYPEFVDPNGATSLEVIRWDEENGAAIPFKVVFAGGRWSIPSHYDYPADGKDRLSKTAASIIGLKKDDFRSNNVSDHELCGVVDPLDEAATGLSGRGERITIRGENDKVLADYIIGKAVEGREGLRFVRLPEQKRIYVCRVNPDLSTKFSDWIEADLLQVTSKDAITEVTIKDYSINERRGTVNQRDEILLKRLGGKEWSINRVSGNSEPDAAKIDELLKAFDELSIVGVRPKPAGLSANLNRNTAGGIEISQNDVFSLRDKGYYFAGNGELVSNEGEMQVESNDGVSYTLRFGEVAYGSGLDLSAGGETVSKSGPADNRFLFITTSFNAQRFPEPPIAPDLSFESRPDSTWNDADRRNKSMMDAHDSWKRQVDAGQKRSEELNARFADWYYVISDENFRKLKVSRADLLKK